MKSTHYCLLLVMLLAIVPVHAQSLSAYPQDLLDRANTAAGARYLTEEEKKTVMLVNLARMDGPAFIRNVLNPYIREEQPDQNEYLTSLIDDLRSLRPLPPLMVQRELCGSAKFHARDMGSVGRIGHNSSDGTQCFDRIQRFFDGGAMGENCSYGFGDALGIVMQLLIDDQVPSLGHRKNILSSDYRRMGVGIAPHSVYDYNCVMDFSD